MADSNKWYWDLDRQRVVAASERGVADNTLGPYDSPGEAANWKKTVEERNDAWDDADEEWTGTGNSSTSDNSDDDD